MWKGDLNQLTSTIEQIGHSLEEHHFKVHHLHVSDEQPDLDPEEDPGSISYIHNNLVATIPKQLDSSDLTSKLRASREVATVIGLANVGISKLSRPNDQRSFPMLRQLHGLDLEISISEESKFLLDTWGVAPEFEQARITTTRPRKRVKFEESPVKIAVQSSSQRDVTPSIPTNREVENTMSQPVRGKFADSRRKFRKSGF